MKKNSMQRLIILLVGIIILAGCAKMVAPTGGPKDTQHPLIVKSTPPSHTINFDEEEINITFDEFIQLKELNDNLIISPPVEEKPSFRVKGKTLNIKFLDELKDSTTYNIYFGNSVQDFNEGNPIENFQYVLSTGNFIDSLSIEGVVLNSFNLLPEENVFVMLYNELEDSIPLKRIPDFISKTNKEGYFRINNIRHNEYKMFCLRDVNRNYLFDKITEDIAFTDSLIRFKLIKNEKADTIYVNDSINNSEKEIETVIYTSDSYYPTQHYTMKLFAENKKVQYLATYNRNIKQKLEFIFNKSVKDSLILSLSDTVINNEWFIKESNKANDTVFYWLTDTSIYNKENIKAVLKYQKEDSNLVYHWFNDTLDLKYYEPDTKKDEIQETYLNFKNNIDAKKMLDLNTDLKFTFDFPLDYFNLNFIDLYKVADSLEIPQAYRLYKDSLKLRDYNLSLNWAEDTSYILKIYPGAFSDIYGNLNDTLISEFKVRGIDYYGKLLANIVGIDSTHQIIAQIIIPGKDKEVVIKQKIVQSDQIVEFSFLHPNEYIFKVILDRNFNAKWDTGDYLIHLQPEEVLYYENKIKVRSNWDHEINFNVKKGLNK